jgi:DNA (cytosine-5)-methyltransferase 1
MIHVFTAFSGYDSQCMALDRLHRHNPDFNYELVGWAEIDKHAIAAHNAVYPQWADRNYGDISKIDWSQVPDFDLFTYSSPCQDFSQAGKQAGGTEGSGTRSSLLWECRRAILAKKPKYLLMENVAALVSQKFIRLFNAWQLELERYGYRNFAKVLNAKDYGVPQNRERIFMVSVLDEQARYEFPDPMPLQLRLKDVLEPKVDERYYLKEKALEGYKPNDKKSEGAVNVVGELQADNRWGNCIRQQNFVIGTDKCSMSITAKHLMHEFKIAEPIVLGWVRDEKGNVVKRPPVEVANTVTSGKRDNTQNYVVEPRCHVVAKLDIPGKHESCCRVHGVDGVAPTQNCCEGGGLETKIMEPVTYRIRKLTERECFRLMDVPEEYIDRIQAAGISRSQQYKMAGNSIVVACMYHLFRKLWIDTQIKTLTLF